MPSKLATYSLFYFNIARQFLTGPHNHERGSECFSFYLYCPIKGSSLFLLNRILPKMLALILVIICLTTMLDNVNVLHFARYMIAMVFW